MLKLKVLGDSAHVQANDAARRAAPRLFLRAFLKCFSVGTACRSSPRQRAGIPGEKALALPVLFSELRRAAVSAAGLIFALAVGV